MKQEIISLNQKIIKQHQDFINIVSNLNNNNHPHPTQIQTDQMQPQNNNNSHKGLKFRLIKTPPNHSNPHTLMYYSLHHIHHLLDKNHQHVSLTKSKIFIIPLKETNRVNQSLEGKQ